MAEYIDLNNTEVLAEAGENAKLVVEEDGELKRIPASAVGQVKTVNGVEPDEAGNVGVSYNNLLDKPFYDDSIVIEWDGNIGDRVHVVSDNMGAWVKMTDRVLTVEEINGASYETSYGTAGTFTEDNLDAAEGVVIASYKCPGIVSISRDNYDIGGVLTFPEKGTYFADGMAADGRYYCTKFVKNKIKPLDAKFLPVPMLPVLMLTRTREGYSFNTDYSTFRNSVAQGAILVFNDALNKNFYHGGNVHFGENGVGVHFETEGYTVAQVSFLSDGTITDDATA